MFKFDLDSTKKYSLSRNAIIDLDFTYQQYSTRTFVTAAARGIKVNADTSNALYPVGGHKPEGLWYAFGRSWIDWRLAPSDRGTDDCNLHPLFELNVDTDNFIKLTCLKDIRRFHDIFGCIDTITGYPDVTIDWVRVAAQYDGIEISPYDSHCCDLHWYKTYDIASGCIWNLKTIKNIIRVNKEPDAE